MGQIAIAVKHLIAAGIAGDALVRAIEDMEAAVIVQQAETKPARSRAAERQERYRARRALGESDWETLRGLIIERDGDKCSYCGAQACPPFVDHIIPLLRGGENSPENLCVSCGPCNSSKAGRDLNEWIGGVSQ